LLPKFEQFIRERQYLRNVSPATVAWHTHNLKWLRFRISDRRRTHPKPTPHYTLEQVENIISALVNHVDCQLMIALSFFAGLRPSEIAGLRWEDLDTAVVNIRRACVRGVVGIPKTPESLATLPLLPQVTIPLTLWRQKCGNPTDGWLFANERGKPQNLKDVVSRTIRPTLGRPQ
jgi:integrase